MKVQSKNKNYIQQNPFLQSKNIPYFTGSKFPPKDLLDEASLSIKKPKSGIGGAVRKVLSKVKFWEDKDIIEKQQAIGGFLNKTGGKLDIPIPPKKWASINERSWYLNGLTEKHIQNDENNFTKIVEIFEGENSKSKLTNQELSYLRNGTLKMKPVKDDMISRFLDVYKKAVDDYNPESKPQSPIHLRMLLIEKPEVMNVISPKTLTRLIKELERTGGEDADLSLLRVIPAKINERFSKEEMQEVNAQLQKTYEILSKRTGKSHGNLNILEKTVGKQNNEPILSSQPEVEPIKLTSRVERIIPKFECEHPVGSKEYFDARLKYIDKTAFEIASAKDEEGFIKFLDEFDALQNITKSTNKGAFTEFGGMKASFYLFKEGQRSDKLLSRFLDTYHNHIEDFGNNLGNASNCGALILTDFYREYGPVSSKGTIMKLLKEFERTGTDESISVKGIGEPFAMQYYFKHLPPAEQKEITAEADRVSNILRDRASKVSKNENNIKE